MNYRDIIIVLLLIISAKTYSQQQDVQFNTTAQLFSGINILKVKRDFYDPYLWVLAQNNQVYRVNSQTLAVDNYTASFSAYSNLQFTDIAGRSADTVFIATNSPNFIQYQNGAVTLIGQNLGITDTVNSVGIAGGIAYQAKPTAAIVMIATNSGFFFYNSDTGTLTNHPFNAQDSTSYSKVYQATWRDQMYRDSSLGTTNYDTTIDSVQYQPVASLPNNQSTVISFLWEGGNEFGYNINTAETIYQSIDSYNPNYMNLFWGNANGMFQVASGFSNSPAVEPSGHYLNGINVNKIENIYGLAAFGEPDNSNTIIKQNLLIGTNNGFYFSSSVYQQTLFALKTFSIFHDDALGNIVINDICVNAASITPPLCENGVWLASNNGLYLVTPSYSPFLAAGPYQAIGFQNQPGTLSTINVCAGDSVNAIINPSSYVGSSVQWYNKGTLLTGQTRDTLAIKATGNYYAVLSDPCSNINLQTNNLGVTIITAPVFSFNYPAVIQQCGNAPDTLVTTSNPGYRYQWYTNNVLNGDTTSTFVATQSGTYKVEVSACTNSWVPSKSVELEMITLPMPIITPGTAVYCAEDTAKLTENVTPAAAYTINWYLNGSLLTADKNLTSIKETTGGSYTVVVSSNSSGCSQTSAPYNLIFVLPPVFALNYPAQVQYCAGSTVALQVTAAIPSAYHYRWYNKGVLTGDTASSLAVSQQGIYNVEVSSCPGNWIPSQMVKVVFVKIPFPSITANKAAYCIGDVATLTTNVPANPSYTIYWYRENVLLENNTNVNSFTTNIGGNYTVTIVNENVQTDGSTCSQTSEVQALVFSPPPTVSITETAKPTICNGETVTLLANFDIGTVQWSTGATTDQINVTTSGTYTAIVTSPGGCQADTSIKVTFLPTPAFHLNDTSLCLYKKQEITLTAPPGFKEYTWNGQPGGQTYLVTLPQTVSLTITDSAGCQATQQILVADRCVTVFIPNAFTPNNDGVNDTWEIEGLGDDPTARVRVFTRYGTPVYESKGYGTNWNGEYNNKKLPAGVYYYVITAKNNTEKFSGPLTILY